MSRDSPAVVLVSSDAVEVKVSPGGLLGVELAPPEIPSGKTAVSDIEVDTISSVNYQNYSIPVGETLVIQRVIAGCEGKEGKGSKVEFLYDQQSGDPYQDFEIATIYVESSTHVLTVNFTAPRAAVSGDRIRIRRTPVETQEVYGKWEGYY